MFSNRDSAVSVDICEANKMMSREQKAAAFEAYLNCFVTKNVSHLRFAEDVTCEGPQMPKFMGRQTIIGFSVSKCHARG